MIKGKYGRFTGKNVPNQADKLGKLSWKNVMKFHFGSNVLDQEKFYDEYIIPSEIEKNVCIDLGCNVGFFTLDHCDKFKNMYAIDASYQNFLVTQRKVLYEVVRMNRATNVACFNLAAAKESGEIIKIYKHESNNQSVSPVTVKEMLEVQNENWVEEAEIYHKVFTISLEGLYEFFDTDYIDYLKVDIEGAEYDLLLDKDLSRVGCLALEMHGTLGADKKEQLKKHLEKYFNIYHVTYDHPAPDHSVITYINKSYKTRTKWTHA